MKQKLFGVTVLLATICGLSGSDSQLVAQQAAQRVYFETQYDQSFNHNVAGLIQLDQQGQELAAQIRQKPDPAKSAELKKLVEESFDKRHAAQVAEATALAEKLAKLQETLKRRQDNKAAIVDRRIKHLLGEADDLDWGIPSPTWTTMTYTDAVKSPFTGAGGKGYNAAVYGGAQATETARPGNSNDAKLQVLTKTPAKSSQSQGDKVKSGSQNERAGDINTSDPKSLEIELALAKVKLKEAEATVKRLTALGNAVPQSELEKSQFLVEKLELEVQLAAHRLENAAKRPKP